MEIRKATELDLEGIYAIEESSFSTPWSKESIRNDLINPVTTYLVAEKEGQITGYIGVWNVMSEGQITNVAVDPNCRGKGIGQKLVQQLLEHAKACELEVLILEVRQSNIAAQKVYSKAGFKEIAVRKNYYTHPKEDAMIMALSLE